MVSWYVIGFFAALSAELWVYVQFRRGAWAPMRPVTVVASPAGLQFENLPGRVRSGHWPREDVQGLSVVLDRVGLRGRRYRLDVRPADAGGRRLTPFRAKQAGTLQAVRRSIIRGMGMEMPAEAVPAEAVPVS